VDLGCRSSQSAKGTVIPINHALGWKHRTVTAGRKEDGVSRYILILGATVTIRRSP